MKENYFDCNSRNVLRVVLVIILFVIVAVSFLGEKVAKDNGIGWDGEYYLNTIQHFTDDMNSNSYDRYAIQRIMPYGLLNVAFQIAGIYPGRICSLIAAGVLSIMALVLSVVFFFKISNLLKWNCCTEIIAFSSFFYSYPILKILGYYILQSDIFGYLFGIMLLYYFLKDNIVMLVLLSIIGAFVWPTVSMSALALAFFPRNINENCQPDSSIDKFLYYSIIVLGTLSPLFIYLYSLYEVGAFIPMLPFRETLPLTCPINKFWIPISCACSCVYLFYMMKPFKISVIRTIGIFSQKNNLTKIVFFFLFYGLITLVLHCLSNPNDGAMTMSSMPKVLALSSMTDPFVFVANHFWYYGPCYLLIIIFWNRTAHYILSYGIGYLFVVALWVLISLSPESRGGIMFLPFVMMIMLQYVNTLKLKSWVPVVFAFVSLLFSRFWFKINVVGMEYYLSWENFNNYTKFPAQRYFMSTGRWQSHEMYYLIMIITIICLSILFIGKKHNFFVLVSNRDNS